MVRGTKTPRALDMKMARTGRTAFRSNTSAELEVELRDLSSGTVLGNDKNRCEELAQIEETTKMGALWPFSCSLRTGRTPAKWMHGIIVPLLKRSESARSMASFRSIMLTRTLWTLA
ncbi:hypothetical protein TRVL_09247 [Trypanosoma vivax]|nr:hypothetical protein TRVL_09247 [Trypanosoma vivax]